jgi:hypothetical protein
MKYLKLNQSSSTPLILLALSLMVLDGCAEFSSTPARVQADYGTSVRSLVNNQIYNPDKAQHPAALLPNGMEGNKADRILEKAYRQDIGDPKDISHSQLGTSGISGRGGSGGSTQ